MNGQNSYEEKCHILLIILLYNPPNNFVGLSLDKTDQVIQNRAMVIRRSNHHIVSLARDWSKRVTWANIAQLKLGNMQGYSPIFKTDG